MDLFEKFKNHSLSNNITRDNLKEMISIAVAEVLKSSKLKRVGINRFEKNLVDVSEIFQYEYPNLTEIEPYLHRETREVIEKSIELLLSGNIPNKVSKFSVKNNVVPISLAIFLDWLIFGDGNFTK